MFWRLFLFAFILATPSTGNAQWAMSSGSDDFCRGNRITVETHLGTSVLIWLSPSIPPAGEELQGDFHTIGPTMVTRRDGTRIRATVELSMLTIDQVFERARRCLSAPIERLRRERAIRRR